MLTVLARKLSKREFEVSTNEMKTQLHCLGHTGGVFKSPTRSCDVAARQYRKRKQGLQIGVEGCKVKDYPKQVKEIVTLCKMSDLKQCRIQTVTHAPTSVGHRHNHTVQTDMEQSAQDTEKNTVQTARYSITSARHRNNDIAQSVRHETISVG